MVVSEEEEVAVEILEVQEEVGAVEAEEGDSKALAVVVVAAAVVVEPEEAEKSWWSHITVLKEFFLQEVERKISW